MNAFDKIIGYRAVKEELIRICDTIKNTQVYEALGVSAPRGLMLYGEPGVGKSLMAGAIIEESGRQVFVCRKDKPNGDFVKDIKATFDAAAENEPSIVLLDDMDKFANGDENHPDAEEYVTVQSCIDQVKGQQVFVLATVNNIRCLPRSLKRAGRFDRIIKVSAPEGRDAEEIVAHYLSKKKFVQGTDPKIIARLLNGRSCAELETVINEAGLYAGHERAETITMEHFMSAYMATILSMPCKNTDDCVQTTAHGPLTRHIAYHEAGHAVISEVLCPESVTLIAIRPDANDHGGVTQYYNDHAQLPLDWTKSRIIGALGGMAATEQVLGVEDAGSVVDLDTAFQLTKELVANCCVCGFPLHANDYTDSETLRNARERTVAAQVEHYYRKAKEILARNREFLDSVAAALEEKGLLTMADLQQLKQRCSIVPVAV